MPTALLTWFSSTLHGTPCSCPACSAYCDTVEADGKQQPKIKLEAVRPVAVALKASKNLASLDMR